MYITSEQLERRIKGREIEAKKEVKPRKNFTVEEKALIGSLVKLDGSATEVAKEFGTSSASANFYSKGIDNPSKGLNTELKEKVEETVYKATTKDSAKELALDALMSSLGVVKNTIGTVKKASEASQVARNMASIVKELEPEASKIPGSLNQINIQIYAPKQKGEEIYDVIEVN